MANFEVINKRKVLHTKELTVYYVGWLEDMQVESI